MRSIVTGLLMALISGIASAQTLEPTRPELRLLPPHPILRMPLELATPEPNPLAFRTSLEVCAQLDCGNEFGSWLDDTLTAAPQTRAAPRQFRWTTDAPGVTGVRWQVATAPFTGGTDDLSGVISTGETGPGGAFTLTFDALPPMTGFVLRPLQPGIGLEAPRAMPLRSTPSTYWIRVIPMQGTAPANTISNSIRVGFPVPPTTMPNPLAEAQADVYAVEVVAFESIRFPTLPWGCVIVESVDSNPVLPGYALFESHRQSGAPLCPSPWKGVGEPGTLEAFWDFASGATDWVSDAYESLKDEAVGIIAEGINALPGNLCDATCEAGLKAGLTAGLVALGVPPTLPNMEELTDQGIDYLVDAAAEEAGIPCDADCRAEIRDGIKAMARDVTQRNVAALCGSVEEAHAHGSEPLCLPSWVTATPAPGSSIRPAQTRLRITRKPGSTMGPGHVLKVEVIATNTLWIGSNPRKPTNTCYKDGRGFSCMNEEIGTITGPLVAPLFTGKHIDLPRLEEGETAEYTFFHGRAEYWLPGHMAAIRRVGGRVAHDDWFDLYRGAEVRVRADILCPQNVGMPASCASPTGTWQTSIPMEP